MVSRKTAFIRLWFASIFGIVAATPYAMSFVQQKGLPAPLSLLAMLRVIQGAGIFALVCWAGLWFAEKAIIHLPVIYVSNFSHISWGFLKPSLLGALIVAGATLLLDLVFIRSIFLHVSQHSPLTLFQSFMATFYTAINEEIFMRLFILSMLTWILVKIFGTTVKRGALSVSIVVTAFLFGLMHLGLAPGRLTFELVCKVVLVNSIGGLIYGLLYIYHGLASAIVAHFFADVILYTVPAVILMMLP